MKVIKKYGEFYLLLLLPLLYYLIFQYGPIFGNIIAFRRFYPGGPVIGSEWVGLKYFKMFIRDPEFWSVFRNTIILSVENLVFGFPIPIIFALLLNEVKNTAFKKIVQTTSYLPHFLSIVVVCGILEEALSPGSGIVNKIITSFGGKSINFLQEPSWFRTIYVTSSIWQGMGWGAIIYLAALSGIDPQLYEAAQIDGANRWKQAIHVSLAGIAPTTIIMLILAIGSIINVGYEKVLLLYNPMTYETADVISTFVYRLGVQNNNYSYATAVGLFESVIGLILVILANKLSRKVSDTSLW